MSNLGSIQVSARDRIFLLILPALAIFAALGIAVGVVASNYEPIEPKFIQFKARFGGVARDIVVPMGRVMAIYARENGPGMSFPVTDTPLNSTVFGMDKLQKVPDSSATTSTPESDPPVPPTPSRPTLTRIK